MEIAGVELNRENDQKSLSINILHKIKILFLFLNNCIGPSLDYSARRILKLFSSNFSRNHESSLRNGAYHNSIQSQRFERSMKARMYLCLYLSSLINLHHMSSLSSKALRKFSFRLIFKVFKASP